MAEIIKDVTVKKTVFTTNNSPSGIQQYVTNCISIGDADTNVLYKHPAITTVFYAEGTLAASKIADAITLAASIPLDANKSAVIDRMVEGKLWLDSYATKVGIIANDPANRSTREQAATNILASNLTPQKLTHNRKGNPEKPKLSGTNIGIGAVDIEIVNGVDYDPSQTTIIAVEKIAEATVELVDGVLKIDLVNKGQVRIMAVSQKGKLTHFTGINKGDYTFYAYASNGKKQLSLLSDSINVSG